MSVAIKEGRHLSNPEIINAATVNQVDFVYLVYQEDRATMVFTLVFVSVDKYYTGNNK